MTTLYELRAFGGWMMRKSVQLPVCVANQLIAGLRFTANAVYHDGATGIFLCAAITVMAFFVGVFVGGGYEESIKPEGTVVTLSQLVSYGAITGGIVAAVLFIYTCWHCFKQEQQELIERLKD